MDGLVLSVAIGFRSYGGDGIGAAEWIAIAALLVMLPFSSLVAVNFCQDVKTRRRKVTKHTIDHIAKLESFLNGPIFEEMRKETIKIQETKMYFESMSNEETDDEERIREHFNRWKRLYDKSLGFLGDLESTQHLIKEGEISMRVLNSHAGGRILLEYDAFFEPLLRSREIMVGKLAGKEIYYGGTWEGIKKLIKDLNELREKDRLSANPPRS